MEVSFENLHVFSCRGAQEQRHASDVLWLTKSAHRVIPAQPIDTTEIRYQTLSQLGWEEPRGNYVGGDVSRTQLDG
jgi:hypothetical protein